MSVQRDHGAGHASPGPGQKSATCWLKKCVAALEQIPDLQRVKPTVAEFLCGPWAQVMAAAELNNAEGVEDPGGYKNLVNILLWSAQPELTRQDLAKLTRLVAGLLSKLREGLGLDQLPSQ